MRAAGTHLLGMGMVSVKAQQGAFCCQPDLLRKEEKLPRGRGGVGGVRAFTLHLQGMEWGLPLGLQRRIFLGTWQQPARHGTKEPLSLVCLCGWEPGPAGDGVEQGIRPEDAIFLFCSAQWG